MAKFSLNWSAPSNDGNSPVIDYIIQYREVGSPNWLTYSDSISNSTNLIIDNIAQCLNYEFRIAAKNATGISGFSNNASKILGFIPSGVSNLNVVDSVVVTDISLNVSWSAPPNDGGCTINDYIIEYSTNSGSSWTRVTDGVNNNTSYTITGLSVGTYLVRIAPISVVGIGPFVTSSPITATTTPPPGVMSIVEQPSHQKAASTSALATFTTQAVSSNGQPPQYQWQLGVRTWSGDIEWTNIAGANSNTLTTSIDNLYNTYSQYPNNDPNFHYGFVRCQTTAISCNTIETEYAVLYSLFAFFSPGAILSDFEDSSYEFHDTSSEIVNGISYPLFYVPTFENLGIFQSLFNQYCDSNGITAMNFVQDGTKIATVYLQKSLDGINWENAIAPVEIVKNGNICGQDLGPYMNGISYDGNQILYYKSFVEDAWPLNFTSNYLPNNTISSLYSNQQPESVYGPEQDGQTSVKVSWEEELTVCVTNTELSTFPGAISFNTTFSGHKPYLNSIDYARLFLTYRVLEELWYLEDTQSPVLYISQNDDLFGDWQNTQGDGYPPIVISGVCPLTTTTTTTTPAPNYDIGYNLSGAGTGVVNGDYCYLERCNVGDTPYASPCDPKMMLTKVISGPNGNIYIYIYFSSVTNRWEVGNGYGAYYTNSSLSAITPTSGWTVGNIGTASAPTFTQIDCNNVTTTPAPIYVCVTSSTDQYTNGTYTMSGQANGKPYYYKQGPVSNSERYIFWSTNISTQQGTISGWVIPDFFNAVGPTPDPSLFSNSVFARYYNTNNTSDVPLTGWVAGSPFAGTPPQIANGSCP